jgi:hypothetical protein
MAVSSTASGGSDPIPPSGWYFPRSLSFLELSFMAPSKIAACHQAMVDAPQ